MSIFLQSMQQTALVQGLCSTCNSNWSSVSAHAKKITNMFSSFHTVSNHASYHCIAIIVVKKFDRTFFWKGMSSAMSLNHVMNERIFSLWDDLLMFHFNFSFTSSRRRCWWKLSKLMHMVSLIIIVGYLYHFEEKEYIIACKFIHIYIARVVCLCKNTRKNWV